MPVKLSVLTAIVLLLAASLAPPAVVRGQSSETDREWNRPVKPFRVIGNIYYVGASEITSFLITTPQGHILIDSGFAETVPIIRDGIKQLGFRLEDVKILLNTQPHYDHAGGLALLKELTGAQLVVSRADAAQVESGGKGDFAWGDKFSYRPAKVDRLIEDKDSVELGGVRMTARLTPGHTKGCTTWVMKADDGGKKYDVLFLGSTTAPGYKLVNNPNYPNIVADYQYTFRLLKTLPCDVFLASHGSFFALQEKIKKLERGTAANPFVDPQRYKKFLEASERDFLENLKNQQAGRGN